MINLQSPARRHIDLAPAPVQRYSVRVTDARGLTHFSVIESSLEMRLVRLEVQRRAIVAHGARFSYSVRGL